jgi:hypothetical protein
LGWDLATITSLAEQSWLDSNLFGSLEGEYWIGGSQNPLGETVPTAGWEWVTSEAWSYTNWAAGEPNDAYGPGSEQHLGANFGGLYWNDEGNLGNIAGYVAEKAEVIPEPGTMLLLSTGLIALAGTKLRMKRK